MKHETSEAKRERLKGDAFISILLGLFMFGMFIVPLFQAEEEFAHASVTTIGHVVRFTTGSANHVAIGFKTGTGQYVEFPTSRVGGFDEVGEPVAVRYNPANPQAGATLDSFGSMWGMLAFLSFLALLLILAGVSVFLGWRPPWMDMRQ